MRKLSMHVTIGAHNHRHNEISEYRAGLAHVDPEMMRYDVVLKEQTVASAYDELFSSSVEEYNARQKRADRRIDGASGYYRKIMQDVRGRGRKGSKTDKGKRPVYEAIVGLGNRDTFSPRDAENRKIGNEVLTRYYERFQKEFPNLHVVQSVIHNDEPDAGIHLQIAYVPYGEGYKRGLKRQQSLSKACENMGFSHMDLPNRMRSLLEDVCRELGVERLDMHNHEHHKPLPEFKEEQRELERLAKQAERSSDSADALAATPTGNAADEASVLRAEVAALRRRNEALEGLLDKAARVIASMAQAVGLLVYDDSTPYAAPGLSGRPRRMVEAVNEYAAKWLRGLGKAELARHVEDEVFASPGIIEQVKGERSLDVGRSR